MAGKPEKGGANRSERSDMGGGGGDTHSHHLRKLPQLSGLYCATYISIISTKKKKKKSG